jgi:acyl-CoA synthetase (AMP-forming)/AMP-acid ligase II/acyl carrier protein
MNNIVDYFSYWVGVSPQKNAFISLENKEERYFTYKEIEQIVQGKSFFLQTQTNFSTTILLYDDTIDFLTSFLACQQLGIIAIPMFYPRNRRHFNRLKIIIENSESKSIFCSKTNFKKINKEIALFDLDISVLALDKDSVDVQTYERVRSEVNSISFIQYTSGSTGNPKGVIVTQENLLHNQSLIQRTFSCDESSIILSWLPFYHDMGFIGNILHTLYTGGTCVLMSGVEVLQNPILWLKNIEKYRVTHSGGPNFIYDHCIKHIDIENISELNLSSWEVAYNGSEPIKASTINSFVSRFELSGFRPLSFQTCYGLAEATLIVSGGNPVITEEGVGSGKICTETSVIFLDLDSGKINDSSGELCLAGKSITNGYWKTDSSESFIEYEDVNYFRTGDYGEMKDDILYLKGRLKEMIIIHGKNYYPYDLENDIAEQVQELEDNGVIVSYLENEQDELLVFAEIKRKYIGSDKASIIRKIDQVLIDVLGVDAYDIQLLNPRKLPRTSSGKLQRVKIKQEYLSRKVEFLEGKRSIGKEVDQSIQEIVLKLRKDIGNEQLLREYLLVIIRNKLSLEVSNEVIQQTSLLELGLNSLSGVELAHQINQDLKINLETGQLLTLNHFSKVHQFLNNILWLKTQPDEGGEIVI